MRKVLLGCFLLLLINTIDAQTLVVLGTTQDAGKPQIGCQQSCCSNLKNRFYVSSLGVSDTKNKKNYLFDASPDITTQTNLLSSKTGVSGIAGIFVTHAHIGHYTGLMYLGKEGLNTVNTSVYAMPRLKKYLTSNGPWSQLVTLNNIDIKLLRAETPVELGGDLIVIPISVPHRDEFSETVGYKILGAKKSALFIPDIDKWNLWQKDIVTEVKSVDYAFIDGTFFADGEINRPIKEVLHPFISETVSLFNNEPIAVKQKIYFIHLNHTNPAHNATSPQRIMLEKQGFHFATVGASFVLN
ncbi:MAG: coenzyme synthesis protein [Bacteroidota bacterium]|jgi:pyrroloquinoline quinone biosynthesis protein B